MKSVSNPTMTTTPTEKWSQHFFYLFEKQEKVTKQEDEKCAIKFFFVWLNHAPFLSSFSFVADVVVGVVSDMCIVKYNIKIIPLKNADFWPLRRRRKGSHKNFVYKCVQYQWADVFQFFKKHHGKFACIIFIFFKSYPKRPQQREKLKKEQWTLENIKIWKFSVFQQGNIRIRNLCFELNGWLKESDSVPWGHTWASRRLVGDFASGEAVNGLRSGIPKMRK